MRAWALLCLLQALFARHGAEAKRLEPFMVDPLMRRSPLEKNFMRFGRSSPAFAADNTEDSHGRLLDPTKNKDEKSMVLDDQIRFGKSDVGDYLRFGRSKQDNFIRFGRAKSDSFVRFGRGKQDNFMRLGRGKQDNFMRLGRGKQDNFMRFGRGKQDNFMRFGRGKQDNFMRFGRGKHDNFMRFGRENQDNSKVSDLEYKFDDYMRNIRGKQENFMRFGRELEDQNNEQQEQKFYQDSRGKKDSFMRVGKYFFESPESALSTSMNGLLTTPIRDSRGNQGSFVRFGKSKNDFTLFSTPEISYGIQLGQDETDNDSFQDLMGDKAKRITLIRTGRQPINKDDSFIRFGRNSKDQSKDIPENTDLNPQRLKRSALEFYPKEDEDLSNLEPNGFLTSRLVSVPEYSQEETPSSERAEEAIHRRKKSVALHTHFPSQQANSAVDFISTSLYNGSYLQPELPTSLISAGLPNVIVGPEFSLLPDLGPPSSIRSGNRPGDQNFLRLG